METFRKYGRIEVSIGVFFVVLLLLGLRLFYIQVIEHDKYDAMARNIQTQELIIQPKRGEIYTRFGSETAPLVLNETIYTIFADPQQIDSAKKVISEVGAAVGDRLEIGVKDLEKSKTQYMVLARGLSNEQNKKVEKLDLEGVGSQKSSRRYYPEDKMLSRTLGFVNVEGEGQYGVEGEFNDILSGKPGLLSGMTDIKGTFLPTSQYYTSIPAENGENIVLSIDRNIQYAADQILDSGLKSVGATKGSIVVMDPQDGSVLAMSSSPSYNPAQYSKVENADLFLNPVVNNAFEPGSVTKVLTMAAAIDSGAVNQKSTFYNSGCVKIYEDKVCNVEQSVSNRTLTATDIFRYSLNTGVIWTLEQMGGGSINNKGKNTLYNYFHGKFRLDDLTGIEQAAESKGDITKPNSNEAWDIRYANMTFGQGFNTTMIEMTSAFAAVVNGGTYYKPHLLYGTLDDENSIHQTVPEVVTNDVVKPETSKAIRQMMFEARDHSGDSGHYVGSKSGTAQVYDAKTGNYSKTNFIGTHLGFGADSSGNAKYVIMVRVDDSRAGGYAGTIAAGPIFTNMSNWIINYKGISK
ncbi:MAG: penicillin-binding protein 2 [Candidatus Nomurabacteria bacterium]|jgi:cell division protein FtsI/penicillin-binding protein 2|nr:penicillin-binding protein 2 [Candidatus Nomurabacteria bacterium]